MESSTKLLRLTSSWENRHSFESSNSNDEEFYEEIEAPKFVDFTVPDHYFPDDRYWFCDRVGCDQKHEEEMDSEAIFKKFVRRAMAARSPNVVRLRKILDASRKCPLSAPAKPSRSRLSGKRIISTFLKRVDGEEKVVGPILKPRATPVAKTRTVAAKYLTTPRNKRSTQGENSFRSVRNPKPNKDKEVSNGRMVAKALMFHSPEKKAVKVKTSVDLHMPVSKVCDGMNKLDVSSGCKVLRRPDESICLDASSNQESKLGKSIESKIRGKSSEQQSLKSKESCEDKEQSSAAQDSVLALTEYSNGEENDAKALMFHSPEKKAVKVKTSVDLHMPVSKVCDGMNKLDVSSGCKVLRRPDESICLDASSNQESKLGKSIESKIRGKSSEQQSLKSKESCEDKEQSSAAQDSVLALTEYSNGEENDDLRSQATNLQENNSSDGKETIDHSTVKKSSGRERDEQYVYNKEDGDNKEVYNKEDGDNKEVYNKEDGDNKENTTASDVNRMHEKKPKQTGRKILNVQDQSGHRVGKKVTQAQNKKLKEGLISPTQVVKLKKPMATNPKPFRLRTDERGILKERRAEHVVPQSRSGTSSALSGKLQTKQGSNIQGLKIPKGQEISKPAAAVAPESKKHPDRKPINVFCESTSMQRLEKFRKISSPLQKHSCRPHGLVPTKIGMTSYLIPGQKLDVINESSPEVIAKRAGKTDDAVASQSSLLVRRPITVAAKPKVQSIHVPRRTASSTKKSKLALL